MPLWIAFALVAVVLQAGFLTAQKLLVAEHAVVEITAITCTVGAVLYAPVVAVLVFGYGETLSQPLIAVGVASGLLNVLVYYSSLHALKRGDVSVVAPFTKAYPLFVALLEPIVLGTYWSWALLGGAALAVTGSYVILLEDAHPLTPLRNLFLPAVLLGVLAALFSGGAVLVDRFAMAEGANPILFVLVMYTSCAIFATTIAYSPLPSGRIEWRNVLRREYLALGTLIAAMTLVLYLTLVVTSATKASIAFQLSVPLTVIFGWLYCDERHVERKLLGSGLIVAGIILVL